MSEEMDITFTLGAETQILCTANNQSVEVHVAIGDQGFTLTGDRGALRDLADAIINTLTDANYACGICKGIETAFAMLGQECECGRDFSKELP